MADLTQAYEARIAALERLFDKQAFKLDLLKGALKHAPPPRNADTCVVSDPAASPSAEGAR